MDKLIRDIILVRMLNAFAVAGITFFSTLSISYPPTYANLYASLVAFGLTFLVQVRAITNDIGEILEKRLKSKERKIVKGDSCDNSDGKTNIGKRFLLLL